MTLMNWLQVCAINWIMLCRTIYQKCMRSSFYKKRFPRVFALTASKPRYSWKTWKRTKNTFSSFSRCRLSRMYVYMSSAVAPLKGDRIPPPSPREAYTSLVAFACATAMNASNIIPIIFDTMIASAYALVSRDSRTRCS